MNKQQQSYDFDRKESTLICSSITNYLIENCLTAKSTRKAKRINYFCNYLTKLINKKNCLLMAYSFMDIIDFQTNLSKEIGSACNIIGQIQLKYDRQTKMLAINIIKKRLYQLLKNQATAYKAKIKKKEQPTKQKKKRLKSISEITFLHLHENPSKMIFYLLRRVVKDDIKYCFTKIRYFYNLTYQKKRNRYLALLIRNIYDNNMRGCIKKLKINEMSIKIHRQKIDLEAFQTKIEERSQNSEYENLKKKRFQLEEQENQLKSQQKKLDDKIMSELQPQLAQKKQIYDLLEKLKQQKEQLLESIQQIKEKNKFQFTKDELYLLIYRFLLIKIYDIFEQKGKNSKIEFNIEQMLSQNKYILPLQIMEQQQIKELEQMCIQYEQIQGKVVVENFEYQTKQSLSHQNSILKQFLLTLLQEAKQNESK